MSGRPSRTSRRFSRARSGSAKPVALSDVYARDADGRPRGGGRRREEIAEGRVHAGGDPAVQREEAARGDAWRPGDPHAPREEAERRRVVGQRMRLELVQDLQAVLDGAEMHERVAEEPAERRREIAALGEAEDRAQRVPLAQPRVVPGVEELERLHQELDLADAADPELHVPALAPPCRGATGRWRSSSGGSRPRSRDRGRAGRRTAGSDRRSGARHRHRRRRSGP